MKIRNDSRRPGTVGVDWAAGASQPQVFVVSDPQEIRDFILWLLCSGGYRVVAADNDTVARSFLSTGYPVLVVTEVEIPFCEDWELLAFSHVQFPEAPVLVASRSALGRRPEINRMIAGSPVSAS